MSPVERHEQQQQQQQRSVFNLSWKAWPRCFSWWAWVSVYPGNWFPFFCSPFEELLLSTAIRTSRKNTPRLSFFRPPPRSKPIFLHNHLLPCKPLFLLSCHLQPQGPRPAPLPTPSTTHQPETKSLFQRSVQLESSIFHAYTHIPYVSASVRAYRWSVLPPITHSETNARRLGQPHRSPCCPQPPPLHPLRSSETCGAVAVNRHVSTER